MPPGVGTPWGEPLASWVARHTSPHDQAAELRPPFPSVGGPRPFLGKWVGADADGKGRASGSDVREASERAPEADLFDPGFFFMVPSDSVVV